jgi:hypothetical protein
MKYRLSLLIAILLIAISFKAMAQETGLKSLKDFKVVVERTDNGIKMKSLKGTAWIDLSFSLKNNKLQAIDEYGMTDLGKVSKNKDSNLADFLFTITKTEKGIELKGIEGTAWTELGFSLPNNKKQAINQFGMTKLN